jgi:hypothetical protein
MPVFSETNMNCDKHKYEKFLHENRTLTASIYGPVTFGPMPLLILKSSATVDEEMVSDKTEKAEVEDIDPQSAKENNVEKYQEKIKKYIDKQVHTQTDLFHQQVLPNLEQNVTLVATGSLQNVDPDRIILKKVIMTGRPIKIHKKTSVIREMFFNPEDVKWFKPIELWTKSHRVGHIKKSVGKRFIYFFLIFLFRNSWKYEVCF